MLQLVPFLIVICAGLCALIVAALEPYELPRWATIWPPLAFAASFTVILAFVAFAS